MNDPRASIILCGPQRTETTAGPAITRLAPEGPIATITAGWQERERDDAELDSLFGGRTINLALDERAGRVWRAHPELQAAHRDLQNQLRLLRHSYDVQLDHGIKAWSTLEELKGNPMVLEPEREDALRALRRMDQRHLDRISELRGAHLSVSNPLDHPAVQREREEIAEVIENASAVAIAGGHVAVLVNRCRMFGLEGLLQNKPIVAWSAGAMALTERIVLFHDSPPQGADNAQAFDHGLSLAPGIVVLPHASDRLRLEDRDRTGRFARRFAPAICLLLEGGTSVEYRQDAWRPISSAQLLTDDGAVAELAA
jgi:hypothetical protein